MVKRSVLLWVLVLLGAAAGAPAVAADLVAVRAARILTAEGDDRADGGLADIANGTILIEGGRIRAVGRDLEIPWNAQVFQFPGGVVVPGLIDPHTTAGLRPPNENLPEVPFVTVLDGIDPNSEQYLAALRDGITALHVIPGNSTRFGGQGAVLRPVGAITEAMVIKNPSALKISLSPPGGETRMGQMAAIRQSFYDLHRYVLGLGKDPSPGLVAPRPEKEPALEELLSLRPDWKEIDWEKIPDEKIDERRRPLVDLIRGHLRAFIYCPRASDIFKAFELMDTHGIQATLVLGPDGFRAAAPLGARKNLGPVVLDPELVHYEDDPETGEERRYLAAKILFDAGIRFALQVRERRETRRGRPGRFFSLDPSTHLWYQAARLIQQGIPPEEALRSVTLHPARSLGLEHRMGSIAIGKDANLAIFSGDPFDARSWVDLVMVEGRVVYRREEDGDLKELLGRPERRF